MGYRDQRYRPVRCTAWRKYHLTTGVWINKVHLVAIRSFKVNSMQLVFPLITCDTGLSLSLFDCTVKYNSSWIWNSQSVTTHNRRNDTTGRMTLAGYFCVAAESRSCSTRVFFRLLLLCVWDAQHSKPVYCTPSELD